MKQKIAFEELGSFEVDTTKPEYQRAVLEVLEANEIKDESSLRFGEITSHFPEIKVERSSEDSVIILNRSKLGIYTTIIKVNGFECKVMIDTGAEISVFTDVFLESIGTHWNQEDNIGVSSFNDTKDNMNIALVNRIQIGDVEINNLSVLVINSNKLSFRPLGINLFQINGIVGWDILSMIDFEIDYSNRAFTILSAAKEKIGTPLIKSSFPSILLSSTNDKPVVVGLDTGASKTWVSVKAIDKFDLEVVGEKEKTIRGAHGKEKVSFKIIRSVDLIWDGILMKLQNIRTGYTGFLNEYEYDCIIGNDILKLYSIRVINSKSICVVYRNNIL